MLVLTRKPGERILIGSSIAITVVRIGRNAVRLGIEAPRDVEIVREELVAQAIAMESTGNRRTGGLFEQTVYTSRRTAEEMTRTDYRKPTLREREDELDWQENHPPVAAEN